MSEKHKADIVDWLRTGIPCEPMADAAADEIDRLREMLNYGADFLDDLLRNDADVVLHPCKAPGDVAAELRAAAQSHYRRMND